MARVNVTTQKITPTGLNPALTQPTVDGDIVDTGALFLYVNNGSGGSVDVTVQTPVTIDGLAVSELVVAVPAGQVRMIGPFPNRTFGRPVGGADEGRMYVNYSAQTSVTRAAVSF